MASLNGVKPRFDGKGTEFGRVHRMLGAGYWMFDVDRLFAELTMEREDELYIEYRMPAARSHKVVTEFPAMFEVKAHRTEYAVKALGSDDANALARRELARRIGSRLFVVFATNGRQPFEFHEIDTTTGEAHCLGSLDYGGDNATAAIKAYWQNVLRLEI